MGLKDLPEFFIEDAHLEESMALPIIEIVEITFKNDGEPYGENKHLRLVNVAGIAKNRVGKEIFLICSDHFLRDKKGNTYLSYRLQDFIEHKYPNTKDILDYQNL